MNAYHPLYKPGQLILGQGPVVVVTGWSVKELVAKRLDPTRYAALGQLYSPTRGISYLIRNLLANPSYRQLAVLNATPQDVVGGACTCLVDFLLHGVREGVSDTGRTCWVVRSGVTGYIDREIPLDALESLRQELAWKEAKSLAELVIQIQAFPTPVPSHREPQTFPCPDIPSSPVLPGPLVGQRVQARTIPEAWVKVLQRIRATGRICPTAYDSQWQELLNLLVVVEGDGAPYPKFFPQIGQEYLDQVLEDAMPRDGVKYTYGQRLRSWFGVDQLQQLIDKLKADPYTTRSVMNLWDVADYHTPSPPCLNHIWCRVSSQRLVLTAVFRSNDMWAAWPANVVALRALQTHIRDAVDPNLNLGPLTTLSESAHIYEDAWANADILIQQEYPPRAEYTDPVGDFVISREEGELVVEQTTPGGGAVVRVYRGKDPTRLGREIIAANPAIQPDHAFYLGKELEKLRGSTRVGHG